jgi:hypothetical protein
MLISIWIVWRWYTIARTQVHKLVGRGAPAEFVEQLKTLADEHHEQLEVDVIRAYFFGAPPRPRPQCRCARGASQRAPPARPAAAWPGKAEAWGIDRGHPHLCHPARAPRPFVFHQPPGSRYLVEMEVVLPGEWTLRQSHDVALMLQHKVGGALGMGAPPAGACPPACCHAG